MLFSTTNKVLVQLTQLFYLPLVKYTRSLSNLDGFPMIISGLSLTLYKYRGKGQTPTERICAQYH